MCLRSTEPPLLQNRCACCTTSTNIPKNIFKKIRNILSLGMQGRKEPTPKMLYQVHLHDLIPEHNYYRLLDKAILPNYVKTPFYDFKNMILELLIFYKPKRKIQNKRGLNTIK
jgi:hypothetical protein